MGRKGKWYISIKKIFTAESKVKKDQKFKRKRNWGCGKFADSDRFDSPPPPPPPPVVVKRPEVENEQNNHAYSVAMASAVAAEAAAVAAQAAAEVARLTASSTISGGSREGIAAIKIQTAFRGYMARKRLQALRGFVRLKSLVEGNAVKRRTTNTLYCVQTWARVQSQIHSRRIRMTEENLALQRQLQLKREREFERSKLGEEWDHSLQSKEKVEANLLNKQEAAIRRERALAYAYSHQWKSSSRSVAPTFSDPHNPHWGWSWLERWMAARPWENRSMSEKDPNDNASVKSACRRNSILERTPPPPQKQSRSASRRSPSTPPSKASSTAGKLKPVSPKNGLGRIEDDSRSTHSLHSEQAPRRHSVPGSSTRDNESLVSTPATPSYMTSTESARARSRFQSPAALGDVAQTPEKGSMSSAMKRLSFAENAGRVRRHSGPPKVNTASLKDVSVSCEQDTSNGASR